MEARVGVTGGELSEAVRARCARLPLVRPARIGLFGVSCGLAAFFDDDEAIVRGDDPLDAGVFVSGSQTRHLAGR